MGSRQKYRSGSQESKSLDAVTSGTGKAFSLVDYQKVNWLVVGNGTVAGGPVIIESAHDPAYSGTWNQLASVTPTSNAALGGAADFPAGGFVRARCAAAITGGGNITTFINGLAEGD